MINKNECWNCGNEPVRPVIVTSEPEDIWCLHCAIEAGVSFNTPEETVGRDDIELAMQVWDCDYADAYDLLEVNGEELPDEY